MVPNTECQMPFLTIHICFLQTLNISRLDCIITSANFVSKFLDGFLVYWFFKKNPHDDLLLVTRTLKKWHPKGKDRLPNSSVLVAISVCN